VRRCIRVGNVIRTWLDTLAGRTLVIGSGGLSHEPPVPTLDHLDPAVRERITVRSQPTAEEREARTRRVMAAGMALAAGDSTLKALAPEWDARWMQAVEVADLIGLAAISEESITREAGISAHESKTWVIARAEVLLISAAVRRADLGG
jgi:2,3-dihydroxyphenylpropionate 1,2-dioxygenase